VRTRSAIGCAILLAPPLWASHAASWLACVDVQDVAPALCGALLGALAADGLTGLVHWACDTWGDERTRWLGPGLIRSFREHHRDPRAMLAHDWIEVNREPATAATAALLLLWLPPAQRVLDGHALAYGFVCWLVAYGAAANQLHAWAHAPAPPRAVRLLQRGGWILSPARHAVHHRAPRTTAYCISTGWLNPLLDASGFWRGLERAVGRLTGAEPRRGGRRVRMGPRNRRWQRT
jgi:ubiquitin-conjugating enzyme E2 variant